MFAAALNVGLAICCGGLLVWNLRLEARARRQREMLDAVLFGAAGQFLEDFGVTVDEAGFIVDTTDASKPQAVH